jgi:sRNA-binding protein
MKSTGHDISNKSRRRKAAQATLAILIETWPAAFRLVPQERSAPLKLGIDKDVEAAAGGALTPGEISRALGAYTGSWAYQRALRRVGTPRIALDGSYAGAVAPEEAELARSRQQAQSGRRSRRVRARGLAAAKAAREAREAQRLADVAAGRRKPRLSLPSSRRAGA